MLYSSQENDATFSHKLTVLLSLRWENSIFFSQIKYESWSTCVLLCQTSRNLFLCVVNNKKGKLIIRSNLVEKICLFFTFIFNCSKGYIFCISILCDYIKVTVTPTGFFL